jgi:hypothetical protein
MVGWFDGLNDLNGLNNLNPTTCYFHQLISSTPPTIMAALATMRNVTRSTSRRKIAVRSGKKTGRCAEHVAQSEQERVRQGVKLRRH